jgi:hypothetical protein
VRINESARLTLLQGGVGPENNGDVCTISGCESPGGITSHRIQLQALTESLNDLEKRIDDLESRYSKVLDTWLTVTEHLVRLSDIIINTATIKNC